MIRRRAEDESVFAETKSPGVVVGRTDKFNVGDFRGIRVRQFESPEALTERVRFLAIELRRAVVVTLHAPDPVVQTIAEVADTAVSVTGSEAGHQDSLLVRLVVSIGVLQIDCFGCVLDHRTAAINHNRGWDRKTFGEDCELVGNVVAVSIFADSNTVAVLTELIRIVERFADP